MSYDIDAAAYDYWKTTDDRPEAEPAEYLRDCACSCHATGICGDPDEDDRCIPEHYGDDVFCRDGEIMVAV